MTQVNSQGQLDVTLTLLRLHILKPCDTVALSMLRTEPSFDIATGKQELAIRLIDTVGSKETHTLIAMKM